MTANVHHLCILQKLLENLVPFMFVYVFHLNEPMDLYLATYVKRTQHIDAQILETVSICQSLPYVVDHHLPCDSEASDLYYRMKSKIRYETSEVAIGENYALGKIAIVQI